MVNNYKRAATAAGVITCARAAERNVKVKLIVSDKVVVKQPFWDKEAPGMRFPLKQLPSLKHVKFTEQTAESVLYRSHFRPGVHRFKSISLYFEQQNLMYYETSCNFQSLAFSEAKLQKRLALSFCSSLTSHR